jgi:hypothetical protein
MRSEWLLRACPKAKIGFSLQYEEGLLERHSGAKVGILGRRSNVLPRNPECGKYEINTGS